MASVTTYSMALGKSLSAVLFRVPVVAAARGQKTQSRDYSSNPVAPAAKVGDAHTFKDGRMEGMNLYTCNKMDRYILLWMGKYSKIEDVPFAVEQAVIAKARNQARIRMNIGFCVAGVIACIGVVIAGKSFQKRGLVFNYDPNQSSTTTK